MRKLLIIFGVVLVAAVILVWRMPARWFLDTAQPALPDFQWSHSEGTAWRGRMLDVSWNGLKLGTLQWRFDGFADTSEKTTRWEILSDSSQHQVSALVTFSPDGDISRIADMRGHAPAAWLDVTRQLPWLYLDGTLQVNLEHLDLENNLPVNGAGQLVWSDAAVKGGANERFGDLEMNLTPHRAGAHEGIDFDFRSRGPADIFTEGHGTSYLRDYELSIQLKIASDRGDLESFMQQLGGEVSPQTYRYSWRGTF